MENDKLSKVPLLMEQWRDSRNTRWPALLQARSALLDGSQEIIDRAFQAGRGITSDEQKAIDGYVVQVRGINADLAKHKAEQIKEHGADMIHLPF
jgi:hypothetical protein